MRKHFLLTAKNSPILNEVINTMLECYLNLQKIPDLAHTTLSFACICEQQQQDQQWVALQVKYPEHYIYNHWVKIYMAISAMYVQETTLTNNGTLPHINNVGANCKMVPSSYGTPWRKKVVQNTATALPSLLAQTRN